MKCVICNLPAAGVHYGVHSCEGCRAFFKRSVLGKFNKKCFLGGNCSQSRLESSTSRSNFPRCKPCRYQQCLQQGMKPNLVVVKGVEKRVIKPPASAPVFVFTNNRKSTVDQLTLQRSLARIQPQSVVKFIGTPYAPQITSILAPIVTASQLLVGNDRPIPPFLHQTFPKFDDHVLLEIARAVERAAYCAHYEEQQQDSAFMRRALQFGEVPTQPESSPEITIANIAVYLPILTERNSKFLELLPGFSDVQSLLNKRSVAHRYFLGVSIILTSPLFHDDELYMLVGPKKLHYCRYWRDRLVNQDFRRLYDRMVCEFKKLELTPTERYVFMAACNLDQKSAISPPAYPLSSLQQLYLNVLEYLIRSRSTMADDVIDRTRQFMRQLDQSNMLLQQYIPPPSVTPNDDKALFSSLMRPDEGLIK